MRGAEVVCYLTSSLCLQGDIQALTLLTIAWASAAGAKYLRIYALVMLLLDQIKPIEQLVPVS